MQSLAINKNINGWAKNRSLEDVEAVIVGHNKEIQELIKLCEIGPRSAIIDRIQINDYNKNYLKESFDIF